MRILRNIVVVVMALVLVLLLGGLALYYYQQWQSAKAQEPLAAFYTPPESIEGEPGTVIRSEPAPQWMSARLGRAADPVCHARRGWGAPCRGWDGVDPQQGS